MTMTKPPKRFLYLLTLWQEQPMTADQPALWRFSLEDTRTRQRHGFATLDAMVAFLRARMMAGPRAQSHDAGAPSPPSSHSD